MANQSPPPHTPPPGEMSVLSSAQLESFHRDGFLVVESWWDAATCSRLKSVMDGVLRSTSPPPTRSLFSTDEQARSTDEYFLSSGDKVSFFYEPKAFGPDGALVVEPHRAINKVGHNIHELIPEFREVSFDPRLASLCSQLGYERPVIPQSMYILKEKSIGGAVNAHQDGTFLFTTPQSVLGLWWPLEDCTTENGCLWAVPGSHLTTPVARRFKRTPAAMEGAVAAAAAASPAPPPAASTPLTSFDPPEAQVYSEEGAVPLVIPAGSLVILHSAVVHFSRENKSDRSRHAYSIHCVEGGKGVVYPKDNWLQRPGYAPFPDLATAAAGAEGSSVGGSAKV